MLEEDEPQDIAAAFGATGAPEGEAGGGGAEPTGAGARLRAALQHMPGGPGVAEEGASVGATEPAGADLFDEEPELNLPIPMPVRRQIDPAVLAVLRSEAEVETRARRNDAMVPAQSQGELSLPANPRRSASEVRARLAKLQEAERKGDAAARWTRNADTPADLPEPDPVTPPGSSQMGGFPPLPPLSDIRPKTRPAKPSGAAGAVIDRSDVAPASPEWGEPDQGADAHRFAGLPAKAASRELAAYQEQQAQRGFRIGFAVPVAMVCIGLGLYLSAPGLIARLPDAAPALERLVARGDQVQEHLATGILAAFDRLGAGGDS